MEPDEITRTIKEARGFAELGLFQEAWDLIESLPPAWRTDPTAIAVRLLVCAGQQKWEMGAELVRVVAPYRPLDEREAAGQFHLALAESHCANGDVEAAKDSLRALAIIWSEGRGRALASPSLASLW